MTIKKTPTFTPELLVEAPRPSGGAPNETGTHVLYTVSKYSIEGNAKTTEVRVMQIETGASHLFSDDPSVKEPQWLTAHLIMWKKVKESGESEIWAANATGDKNAYVVGTIGSDVSAIKTAKLSDESLAFTFVAPVSEDSQVLNPKSLPKQSSSGREWESGRVRFWDQYYLPYATTVFYTTLVKTESKFKLSKSPPVDAFQNSPFISPYTTGPEDGGYDVSPSGILINTVDDVNHDASKFWFSETFYIPLKTFTETTPPEPIIVTLPGIGPAGSAVFSPDGKSGAVTRTASAKRLTENPRIYVFKTDNPTALKELPILNESKQDWDLHAEGLLWSLDGRSLYVSAQRREIRTLFHVFVPEFDGQHVGSELPPVVAQPLSHAGSGSVSSAYRLGHGSSLFVNSSSMTDNMTFSIVSALGSYRVLFSGSNNGALFGINRSQVSGFLYPGDKGYKIQCLVVLPSNFEETKKYPVLLLIHGGPASTWGDSWSTRWNPALMAEQGYIILMPNITGSDGFGQKFRNDNFADWGGRPYRDIEKLWDFVQANISYADTERAAILGGSYGGYMMYHVAGQPLAKKFKTIVSHDGIFTMPSMLAADVSAGLEYEVGSNYWDDMSKWDAQDPSRNVSQWTQPMLIIHSDLDYRCTLDSGMAGYAVLKGKGIDARLLNFPDEGHWVLKNANSLHWHKTVLGWCNTYCGVTGGVELEPPASERHLRGRGKRANLQIRNGATRG